jgi:predicted nucleic acid-binding protein
VHIADTSFLYALLSESDAFHRRALESVKSADAIIVPSEIFAETVSLIQSRVGFPLARAAGDWIRTQERMAVRPASPPLIDQAWSAFRRAKGQLSYPDALVLAWCGQRGANPLAFDRAILQRLRR